MTSSPPPTRLVAAVPSNSSKYREWPSARQQSDFKAVSCRPRAAARTPARAAGQRASGAAREGSDTSPGAGGSSIEFPGGRRTPRFLFPAPCGKKWKVILESIRIEVDSRGTSIRECTRSGDWRGILPTTGGLLRWRRLRPSSTLGELGGGC